MRRISYSLGIHYSIRAAIPKMLLLSFQVVIKQNPGEAVSGESKSKVKAKFLREARGSLSWRILMTGGLDSLSVWGSTLNWCVC